MVIPSAAALPHVAQNLVIGGWGNVSRISYKRWVGRGGDDKLGGGELNLMFARPSTQPTSTGTKAHPVHIAMNARGVPYLSSRRKASRDEASCVVR